ncbi:MAG: 16S rRNA (adenine(1518)-N(6)/adenine(1519)-N(6))-dimethyltransferase RsmA [Puniceicoccales bacterium]|nr:16S rRNA (adenine(1518)-N(6)/adenine(1519)-N(6))-dimethyltransferase RsmA [Puniceicoccales bacterium]
MLLTTDAHQLPPITGGFSLRQTRVLLAALGHSPRKPLGQNFLVDANIVQKSLQLAEVAPGDIVVEIGPGLGTLTAALLAAGATVFAVERDPRLARYLREWLGAAYPGKFSLVEGDAVAFPLAGLAVMGERFKVVANLPYAISTPWIDAVLENGVLPTQMVVMLQREAAERFTAGSGAGKATGAISIAIEAAFERAPGCEVSSSCFFPPPHVDSRLLHLRRRAAPRHLRVETRQILRGVFSHRRKQLGAAFRLLPEISPLALTWLSRLQEWGVSPQVRPEKIPFAAWLALDDIFNASRKPPFFPLSKFAAAD